MENLTQAQEVGKIDRNRVICFRVTDNTFNKLRAVGAELEMNVAEYARFCVREKLAEIEQMHAARLEIARREMQAKTAKKRKT